MKKILLITNDFPPKKSVGSERTYSWYKYFAKKDYQLIVVTKNWKSRQYQNKSDNLIDTNHVIIAPDSNDISSIMLRKFGKNKFSIIRKFFTFFFKHTQYFLPLGVHKNIGKEAEKYLNNNKVDLIIATGEPFVLFKYASQLAKKFEIPWIGDYRDDWVLNHGRTYKYNLNDKLLIFYDRIWEKKFIKNCSGVTSVSEFLTNQIAHRNKYTIPAKTIENGVDLEYLKNAYSPFKKDCFSIVYTGVLYNQSYMDDFYNGVVDFLKKHNKNQIIQIYFIGIESLTNMATKVVEKLANEFPENVTILNRMTQKEVANYQMNANVLLNFIAGDPSKGLIGAKSYVYAATKNPILTIPSIKNSSSTFFPGRNIQHIALNHHEVSNYLNEIYSDYLNGIIRKTNISEDEIYQITREYNAYKMIDFIKNFIK